MWTSIVFAAVVILASVQGAENHHVVDTDVPTIPRANVVCPGNASECPAGNTCCQESDGLYAVAC